MNCCRCGRAICKECIPKLAVALSSPHIESICFCCPKCYHDDIITAGLPYFVSSSVFFSVLPYVTEYFKGLKWKNGTPLFKEPLEIVSRATSTAENRISGRPTLILQLKLKEFGVDRCVGNIVKSAMEPYYALPDSKLVYEDVFFNLVKRNISKHDKKMKRIAGNIFT